jgi:putative membrane protein insertion efficiency factor
VAARSLIFLIRLYKVILSPVLPPACRFHPSCSEYASQAVKSHGALKGAMYSMGRLLRCHPFNPGGYDPVPPPRMTGPGDEAMEKPKVVGK